MAMRVLYVTSEVYPLAKTGGLADVSAALPAALKEFGVDTRVLLPGYPQAIERAANPQEVVRFGDILGCGDVRLLESVLPDTRVPVWIVDCPRLYNRGGGLYQTDEGADWPDNALRYAVLNHAAAALAAGAIESWRPHIVHANDWHAGLLPLMLSRKRGAAPSVFTIHNLAYQGVFGMDAFEGTGLPAKAIGDVEFYGRISYLKAGIRGADAVTTVSPTYAREILTSEYGCGLEGVLRERDNITGILNGADYGIWDPKTDPHIEANYSVRSMYAKALCKAAIQRELGLDVNAEAPLMAFMSRLVHQKMPDLVLEALPALLENGLQFALVAEGDRGYLCAFQELAARYPGQVAICPRYEEVIAHRILAGADTLAHPARFEPCGLVPIYAQRYGTVPIVRRCGGMADSVIDATQERLQKGTATGFSFDDPTSAGFFEGASRALDLYRQPIAWRKIQASAMAQDYSWRRSAALYAELYGSLLGSSVQESDAKIAARPELAKLSA
jgi:starch synthase